MEVIELVESKVEVSPLGAECPENHAPNIDPEIAGDDPVLVDMWECKVCGSSGNSNDVFDARISYNEPFSDECLRRVGELCRQGFFIGQINIKHGSIQMEKLDVVILYMNQIGEIYERDWLEFPDAERLA